MHILDTYLKTVARFLPASDRDDIVRELLDDLRSQIEDREAQVNRPLSDAEVKALLDQFGSPLEVAARYRQKSGMLAFGPVLIGPVLFPVYARVLRFILGLTAGVIVVVAAGLHVPASNAAQALLLHLSIQFAIVTAIFCGAEIALAKRPRMFDVSYPVSYLATPDRSEVPRVSRLDSLAQIVILAILLAYVPPFARSAAAEFARAGLAPAPLWHQVFLAVACLWIASIVRASINLVRPEWTRFYSVARVVLDVAWLAIVIATLRAGSWVSALYAPGSPVAHLGLAAAVNRGCFAVLVVIAVVSTIVVVLHLRQAIPAKRAAQVVVMAIALLTAAPLRAQVPVPGPPVPSDEEIRKVLVDRVDVNRQAVGIVVGIVSPAGRRIVAYGKLARDDARTPDGDTVFEIGSVTKTFTALLLADMAQRHEVTLDDRLAQHLSGNPKVPTRDGRHIALVDLALQASGLPFWPSGIPSTEESAVAMATYSRAQLYDFLGSYELPRDIGSKWEYSNLGYGLLGLALADRAHTDYEQLVRSRITAPLGMKSTGVAVTPAMRARLAAGYAAELRPAAEWNVPLFPGAGGLHSTANDLLTFLAALPDDRCPLAAAMANMGTRRQPAQGFEQALGWWMMFAGGNDPGILTHPGATLGHSAVLAYDPRTRVGVVVLANSVEADVGSIAWHVLRPAAWPWSTVAKARKEVTLDSSVLDRYAGQYRTSDAVVTVVRRDNALFFVSAATPPEGLRLHAEGERNFFVAGVDLQISFTTDDAGRATGLVLRFGGIETSMTKAGGTVSRVGNCDRSTLFDVAFRPPRAIGSN